MASSVEYFMHPSEEEEFVKIIFSRANVSVVRDELLKRPIYEEYKNRESFLKQPVLDSHHGHSSWIIWCKDLGDQDRLLLTLIEAKRQFDAFYEINHPENQVISYKRSYLSNGILLYGELVCNEKRIWDDDNVYVKHPELVKFYRKLARWIRGRSVKATYDGELIMPNLYILPGALKFYQEGGQLGSWKNIPKGLFNQSYVPLLSRTD